MIVQKWHRWMKQPNQDEAWHRADIADELQELRDAKGFIARWSETSDVVYAVTHGRQAGHMFEYPISRPQIIAGYVYMYPKYTSRALFFRAAGKRAGMPSGLYSVRNPKKIRKLEAIAKEYNVDPVAFVQVCKRQLRFWPLLP